MAGELPLCWPGACCFLVAPCSCGGALLRLPNAAPGGSVAAEDFWAINYLIPASHVVFSPARSPPPGAQALADGSEAGQGDAVPGLHRREAAGQHVGTVRGAGAWGRGLFFRFPRRANRLPAPRLAFPTCKVGTKISRPEQNEVRALVAPTIRRRSTGTRSCFAVSAARLPALLQRHGEALAHGPRSPLDPLGPPLALPAPL